MPDSVVPPDVRDQLAQLEARVANLERRINFGSSDRVSGEIIFSYPGKLSDNMESPPIRTRHSHALISVNFVLGTAGTTATTIEVKRSGGVLQTIVIPAASRQFLGMVDEEFGKDADDLSLRIVTAGTNAADLTAQARFS